MKINDPIDNPTEATMSDTTTTRHGFAPTAAFATTRSGAERRSRETAIATMSQSSGSNPAPGLIRRLTALLTGSSS
jgi:hypothetical protein